MKQADKLCYPQEIYNEDGDPIEHWGLTFRERLIIALASNGELFKYAYKEERNFGEVITTNADTIIAKMDK